MSQNNSINKLEGIFAPAMVIQKTIPNNAIITGIPVFFERNKLSKKRSLFFACSVFSVTTSFAMHCPLSKKVIVFSSFSFSLVYPDCSKKCSAYSSLANTSAI